MIRKNLISARKHKCLTQFQVANSIGISYRQYQRLEAGTSNGSIDIWYKLKFLLNRSIDELLEQDTD